MLWVANIYPTSRLYKFISTAPPPTISQLHNSSLFIVRERTQQEYLKQMEKIKNKANEKIFSLRDENKKLKKEVTGLKQDKKIEIFL